ncbi:Defensin SD2 [Linum grandiflorum]
MQQMKNSFPFVAILLVALLILTPSREGEVGSGVMVAEARTCLSQSHKFKGPCSRDSNCASVCAGEGFSDGDCQGFRRRCFCKRSC